MREKRDNRVVFNKVLYEKVMKEVPKKMKVITVYNMIENYKINGSLARRAITELLSKGAFTFCLYVALTLEYYCPSACVRVSAYPPIYFSTSHHINPDAARKTHARREHLLTYTLAYADLIKVVCPGTLYTKNTE
jgi:hypothetical protein